MKFILSIAFILASLLLSGCSFLDAVSNVHSLTKQTVLSPTDFGFEVVEHNGHYSRTTPDIGSLYILWSKFIATTSLSGIHIYIDDKQAGGILKGTYTVIELKPGQYKLSIGDGNQKWGERTINITANKDIYYRAAVKRNLIMTDELELISEADKYAKGHVSRSTYVTMKITGGSPI